MDTKDAKEYGKLTTEEVLDDIERATEIYDNDVRAARDAEWVAAVDEMKEYNIVGPNNDEYSLGILDGWERALEELRTRMQEASDANKTS